MVGSFTRESPEANPGLASILISVLEHFGYVICLYCLSFSFEL